MSTTNQVFLSLKYNIKMIYLMVELEEEELDEGITAGICVNPECDSSHE